MIKRSLIVLLAGLASLSASSQEVAPDSVETPTPKPAFLERPFMQKRLIQRALDMFCLQDTNYVERNKYDWTVMGSVGCQVMPLMVQTPDGRLRMMTRPSMTVAPHFGWRFLVYSYGITVLGHNTHLQTQRFCVFTRPFGLEAIYQHNKGSLTRLGSRPEGAAPTLPDCRTTLATIHAYYILNHNRFSYSAQQARTAPQRRNSGSAVLGLRYDYQSNHFDTKFTPPFTSPGSLDLTYHSLSVTAGYAYNWVLAPNWLVGAGIHPSVGINIYNRLSTSPEASRVSGFSTSLVGRLGLIWNNGTWFVGLNANTYNYYYTHTHTHLYNSQNYFSAFFGMKFGSRKNYR